MAGAQAIAYSEIESWARLSGIRIEPMEVAIICRLDDIYRTEVSQRTREETKKKAQTPGKAGRGK